MLIDLFLPKNADPADPNVRSKVGQRCGALGIGANVLLFGGKKIPELARSLGKAKGEFKKGLAEGAKDSQQDDEVPAEEPKKIEKEA